MISLFFKKLHFLKWEEMIFPSKEVKMALLNLYSKYLYVFLWIDTQPKEGLITRHFMHDQSVYCKLWSSILISDISSCKNRFKLIWIKIMKCMYIVYVKGLWLVNLNKQKKKNNYSFLFLEFSDLYNFIYAEKFLGSKGSIEIWSKPRIFIMKMLKNIYM